MQSPQSALVGSFTRLRPWHVYSGALVLLAVLWGALFFVIRGGERVALESVYRSNSNLARAVAQHAEVTLGQADHLALYLRDLLKNPEGFSRISPVLKQQVRSSEAMLQAAIAVADGTIIWTSVDGPAATIRDREHFQVHVAADMERPFVSKPVLGRVSGNWSVQVTRRVNDENGGFAGVIVISLDPFYFTRRFAKFDIGASGQVALVGADGIIRARTTGAQKESAGDAIGAVPVVRLIREQTEGRDVTVSPIDGIERFEAFQTVGDYGVAALVGVASSEAMAAFRQSRRNYLIFGGLASVLILAMTVLTVAGLRRQIDLLEEAEAARARAERSNARKTEFVGAIAHEVRTPLSNIIGYAQLIATGKGDASRYPAFARQVEAAGLRVSQIMNDLLEIARIEAGNLVLTPTRVSVRELVGDCLEQYEAQAHAKGLQLKMHTGAEVPEFIEADRARLEQVLSNLVGNAVKHSGQGDVEVRLQRRGAMLEIAVSDQGEGIPAEVLQTLFNRFESEMSPVALRITGTGLGLSIVKVLVERMGGRISAETGAGQGTRFQVELPLRVAG